MENLQYSSGSSYAGKFCANGNKTGYGVLNIHDGAKYCGQFEGGLFCGLGVLTLPDGSQYEGEFVRGKFHGYGTYVRNDSMVYRGQFRDGRPEGYGSVVFPDGSHGFPRNEGYFENFALKKAVKSQQHVEQAKQAALKARRIQQES